MKSKARYFEIWMLETSMASVVLETSPTNLFQLSLGEFVCILEERTGKDLRILLQVFFFLVFVMM